jgi:hypothetical protein
VRMLELCGELNLAAESLEIDSGRELGRQNFHDYFSSERSLLGEEYARHASASELALEGVIVADGALELFS